MAINSFRVSYDNFELDQIIQPDEFNVNFADIMIRVNQIIDVLNQITDGIGGDGADIIHIGSIEPFTPDKLKQFLEDLVAQLRSSEPGSGAEFIGSLPIDGIDGETVHDQLLSVVERIEDIIAELNSQVSRLDTRVDTLTGDVNVIDNTLSETVTRVNNNESAISSLDANKANISDVYTKSQSDTNLAHLEAIISLEYYNRSEMDNLLNDKVTVGDDHTGTWQGINVSDLADKIGVSGVSISNERPSNPSEKMLWFNPSLNEYQLYLDGQWRIHTKPTQIKKVHNRVVLDSDTNSVDIGIPAFNPALDAFIVAQNSTFIAEGYEYNVSPDGHTITKPDGVWESGTTFDFVAFISTPVGDDRVDVLSEIMTEEGENWEVE